MRTAMVTGATGVIGGAIATGLAERGYRVVLACRDEARAGVRADEIRAAVAGADVRVEVVDVSRRESIEDLGRRVTEPLAVLINNAAITPRRREETPEGIELQWATNVLGYLWMASALRPALAAADEARLVNVASYWAGGLDTQDPEFKRRRYDNDTAYRQSKQADRMLTAALSGRFERDGITVNASHPGDLPSKLARNLGFGGGDSPTEAAATPLKVATERALRGVTGKYFEHGRQTTDRFCSDAQAIDALLQLCESY